MSGNRTFVLDTVRPGRKYFAGILALLSCLCLSRAAAIADPVLSPFGDVLPGDPAYKALKLLVRAGIVHLPSICFPSGKGLAYDREHRSLTRYEFAVATQRALADVKAAKQHSHGKRTARQIAFESAVNRLAVEFKRELAELDRR